MLGLRNRKGIAPIIAEAVPETLELVDSETGLATRGQFTHLLEREIARALRYGANMALVIFDVSVNVTTEGEERPSPAPAIAGVLRDAARTADIVARIGEGRYAVMLCECDVTGAELFSERTRTRLSTQPYARLADGSGVYMRAWAGSLAWEEAFETAESYLAGAEERLEVTMSQLESRESWFRGVY